MLEVLTLKDLLNIIISNWIKVEANLNGRKENNLLHK